MENTIEKLNRCRVCGSREHSVLFIKDNYEVTKCGNCGLVFLNFAPSDKFLSDYYAEDFFNDSGTKDGYSDYKEEAVNLERTFRRRINILKRYQEKGGALLDIGCATGEFMKLAAEYWNVYGVEISSYASRVAEERGLNVFNGKLEQSPYLNSGFNVVTLWDTIEHVAEPLDTMRLINKIVRPKGIVALTTGDVGSFTSRACGRYWHLYNIPQHLSYFGKETITDLLKRSGFKVVEITYPALNFTLDYLLFRSITLYNLKFALPAYRKFTHKGLLNLNIKINLFDVMLVIAQKDA